MAEEWLTLEDVADLLNTDIHTVCFLKDFPSGKKHPQDGRRRVWRRAKIEAYAAKNGRTLTPRELNRDDELKVLTIWNDLGEIRHHIGQQTEVGLKLARFYWNLTHPQTEGQPHD